MTLRERNAMLLAAGINVDIPGVRRALAQIESEASEPLILALEEARDMAQELCKIIIDAGLVDRLPNGCDGFGVRAGQAIDAAMRRNEEKP